MADAHLAEDVALATGREIELAEQIVTEAGEAEHETASEHMRAPGKGAHQGGLWHPEGEPPLELQLEGILFVADRPVSMSELMRSLDATKAMVENALRALEETYAGRGMRLQRNQGMVQLASAPAAAPAIQRYLGLEDSAKLSRAALETLSITAYRQPVTRPEVDDLRGVNSDGVMRTLLSRGMIEPVGQRETVGHPIEYGTTFRFLEYFGIGSLDELPPLGALEPIEEDEVEGDDVEARDDGVEDDATTAEEDEAADGSSDVDDVDDVELEGSAATEADPEPVDEAAETETDLAEPA